MFPKKKETMNKKTIKRLLRIVFIIASISSLYFVPWVLVKAWILPLPDTVQEQLEEGISHGFDGMIVYVDQAGKPPEFYAAGWHDRKNKIPAYPQALFKIASITKLYIAVATTKLVKEGRLSLDKTLAEYFPELARRIENSDKITLRMMVQHRSGIPNFVDHPDYWIKPPKNRKETLEYALGLPADFEPDEDYGYSNTNYMLIEDLIDKTLGYSHQQYIKEEILIPLGLKHTFGSLSEVNIDDVMSGYYVGVDKDFKTENTGLMLATAEDVGIFLRALNDGSVFNKGEQEIYSSIYVYEHTGLLPGYQSIAKYYKDIDTVVIQFNNTTNFDGYDWNLAEIIYSRIVKIVRRKKSA
ncbi:CubicO group peptidase, beta-lactamase class C family [Flavobacterium degerlachei]|jgi:CubicO group peptidase (beta-lactamase class C family)|uniref:CubicO group peptidase, beta-lactamase class C family n=2 Tax=Flavobacterium degerlachei TaxID=229203 RepID=A0A1H3E690_9FLAO|nr:CubicO group peptidase, beta-lactamase class C family [Flavobacterium degerlachei]